MPPITPSSRAWTSAASWASNCPPGVQRLADELVHRARSVVLRGVDVIHSGRDHRAQYPQRLLAIARRPEDPVAGELHRAVPGPSHARRAECEAPAKFLSVRDHAVQAP
jgi:hypothetical protein